MQRVLESRAIRIGNDLSGGRRADGGGCCLGEFQVIGQDEALPLCIFYLQRLDDSRRFISSRIDDHRKSLVVDLKLSIELPVRIWRESIRILDADPAFFPLATSESVMTPVLKSQIAPPTITTPQMAHR